MFKPGAPACPVACRYCFITEHDSRRALWNARPRLGINKACTFANVTPWIDSDPAEQSAFRAFPWHILAGDTVGFTAITDPLWPRLDRWLWEWLEQASAVARLVTCVTKWPACDAVLCRLARNSRFRLVVGVGNERVERVSAARKLDFLGRCLSAGVPTLPILHPYIEGVTDLSVLASIRALGFTEIDVKGFRPDLRMMSFIPEEYRHLYADPEVESLPETGWRARVADAGLTLRSPAQWYAASRPEDRRLTEDVAAQLVAATMRLGNIVSSSPADVVAAAIARRCSP